MPRQTRSAAQSHPAPRKQPALIATSTMARIHVQQVLAPISVVQTELLCRSVLIQRILPQHSFSCLNRKRPHRDFSLMRKPTTIVRSHVGCKFRRNEFNDLAKYIEGRTPCLPSGRTSSALQAGCFAADSDLLICRTLH